MDDTCTQCGGPAERGEAFVRSISFRQQTWCRSCWRVLHPELVPQQRTTSDDRATRRWYIRTAAR